MLRDFVTLDPIQFYSVPHHSKGSKSTSTIVILCINAFSFFICTNPLAPSRDMITLVLPYNSFTWNLHNEFKRQTIKIIYERCGKWSENEIQGNSLLTEQHMF